MHMAARMVIGRSPLLAYVCAKSLQSRLTLCYHMDHSLPDSSVHGFSRQEYWSGLSFPPPGDLPDPGIELMSLLSPALAGRFFTTSDTQEAHSPLLTVLQIFFHCFSDKGQNPYCDVKEVYLSQELLLSNLTPGCPGFLSVPWVYPRTFAYAVPFSLCQVLCVCHIPLL